MFQGGVQLVILLCLAFPDEGTFLNLAHPRGDDGLRDRNLECGGINPPSAKYLKKSSDVKPVCDG
jgi:hypothetical protein